MPIPQRLKNYALLVRLDKPIGILLLLWPTMWALWLAAGGRPDWDILAIFTAGVVLMRSAGCVINDLADRHFDPHVQRTRERPLASGRVKATEALLLAGILMCAAFILVLFCNPYTIALSFVGAALALVYPFLKRITHLPQFGLGMAFTWGVPMAFAAVTAEIGTEGWILFFTGLIWPVIYDTMYAMADREDDLKIGVKSTAILFDTMDTLVIGLLQLLFLVMLVVVGVLFQLAYVYFISVMIAAVLFVYQQQLIKDRDPQKCLRAFLNNNWVGLVIFAGIFLGQIT